LQSEHIPNIYNLSVKTLLISNIFIYILHMLWYAKRLWSSDSDRNKCKAVISRL